MMPIDKRDIVRVNFAVDLKPSARVRGRNFGLWTSVFKGEGLDLAGTRPFQAGDSMRRIAWRASARSLSAGGPFVVQDGYGDRSFVVGIVVDRSPGMAHKHEIIQVAAAPIVNGAERDGIPIFYLDLAYGSWKKLSYRPPREGHGGEESWTERIRRSLTNDHFEAPADNLTAIFRRLSRLHRDIPRKSLLFVFSDFINPVRSDALRRAIAHFTVQPVIVQDPVWEMSFPLIDGTLFFRDPVTGEESGERITSAAARQRKIEHEARYEAIVASLKREGVMPLTFTTTSHDACRRMYRAWAARQARMH